MRAMAFVAVGMVSSWVWASAAGAAEGADRAAGPEAVAERHQQGAPALAEGEPAQRAKPQDSPRPWQWQTVARGLDHPWALAFLPEGGFLVTERPGRLRYISPQGEVEPPIGGLPEVAARGQGGLLDLALPADFAQTRQVYFCFAEPSPSGFNGTALAVGELSSNRRRLDRVKVLFRQQPKVGSQLHFGCRIVIQEDRIFLTLGERFSEMKQAQRLDNHPRRNSAGRRDSGIWRSPPGSRASASSSTSCPTTWPCPARSGTTVHCGTCCAAAPSRRSPTGSTST